MSWFAYAIKRAGVPRITPHDLRHSAATFVVSVGANVKVVQKMLGHSSAAMTLDTYAACSMATLTPFPKLTSKQVWAICGQVSKSG